MQEYINIISKEAITSTPDWITWIGGIISIGAILSTFVYWAIVKNPERVVKYLGIVGSCALVFTIGYVIITETLFQQPTGKYKYVGTIDKSKITVSEYEEFISKYNPTIKDGIYFWEDK